MCFVWGEAPLSWSPRLNEIPQGKVGRGREGLVGAEALSQCVLCVLETECALWTPLGGSCGPQASLAPGAPYRQHAGEVQYVWK